MTTIEILQDVRKRILELTNEVLDNSQLLVWLNQAQLEVAGEILTRDRIKKITLNFVNGEADLPSDFQAFYYSSDDYGNEYHLVPIENFIERGEDRMLTIENNKLKVFPLNTSTLSFWYYKKPNKLSSSSNPELPEYTHEVLVLGTCYRALEALQEFDLSNLYLTKYQAGIRRAKMLCLNNEEKGQESKPLFEHVKLI